MIADGADADIFADQESNPKQREKRDQQHGEDDPADRRNAPFATREQLAVASWAVIARHGHGLRLLIWLKVQIRLSCTGSAKLCDRRGPSLRLRPELIGFPGVGTRRRVLEVRRLGEWLRLRKRLRILLRIRRRSGGEIESAESAKIARRVVYLSTFNAFDHRLQLIVLEIRTP